jgi:hypothetical protein
MYLAVALFEVFAYVLTADVSGKRREEAGWLNSREVARVEGE